MQKIITNFLHSNVQCTTYQLSPSLRVCTRAGTQTHFSQARTKQDAYSVFKNCSRHKHKHAICIYKHI